MNPINSLKGQKVSRPYYPTVVVDVDDDGAQSFRDVVLSDSAPDYDSCTISRLIAAGIDPASFTSSAMTDNKVHSFEQMNNFANSLGE